MDHKHQNLAPAMWSRPWFVSWFVPPVVVPIGMALMIAAFVLIRGYPM